MPGPTATTPEVWYKADAGAYSDAGSTLANNNDTVQQWNDQSGNARHATQATGGNRPTYKTSQRNSLPAINFGGSHWLTHSYVGMPRTLVVIGRVTGGGANQAWAGCQSSNGFNSGSIEGLYYFKGAGGSNEEFFMTTTAARGVASTALRKRLNDWHTTIVRFDSSTITSRIGYGSGTVATKDDSGTIATGTTAASLGAAYYGSSIVDHLTGDILELLLYSSELSDAEMAELAQYLARWTPGAITDISSATYVGVTFQDVATSIAADNPEKLQIMYSPDRLAWTDGQQVVYTPTGGNGAVRDPDIIFRNGYYWIVHTNGGYNGTDFESSRTFSVAKSQDLINWTPVVDVDCTAVTPLNGFTWAPQWFVDETDGTPVRVVFAAGADATSMVLCICNPTAADMSTWSTPVSIIGPNLIDGALIKVSSTYYLWFKGNLYVTSSSIASGYGSVIDPGITATSPEGPSPIWLGGSNYRLFFEQLPGGINPQVYYADSADTMVSFGSATALTWNSPFRHGGMTELNAGGLSIPIAAYHYNHHLGN